MVDLEVQPGGWSQRHLSCICLEGLRANRSMVTSGGNLSRSPWQPNVDRVLVQLCLGHPCSGFGDLVAALLWELLGSFLRDLVASLLWVLLAAFSGNLLAALFLDLAA